MAVLTPTPIQQFFDGSGAPLAGGKLFTYLSGTSIKTPTYEDAAGITTNTNPIRLDARGEARIWLNPAISYTFVLANSTDSDPPTSPIWTVNDITAGSRAPVGPVSVRDYGAVGNGIHDDTAAIQAAINAVRAAGGGTVYYPGPASYLVTSSLNSTGISDAFPIVHMGDGRFISKIVHTFPVGEPYPVIDSTGNGHGGVFDLTVQPQGISYATCAFFAAKSALGTSGNGQVVQGSFLFAGNVLGDCAAVFYNTDLCRFTASHANGSGAGLSMGFAKPANVTSKFVVVPTTQDFTQGYITDAECLGEHDSALIWNGGGQLDINNTYAAVVGAGCSAIVKVDSASGSSGNNLIASGLRTENQSAATAVHCIFFNKGSSLVQVTGSMNTDAGAGIVLGSASGAVIQNGFVNQQGTSHAWFDMAAAMLNMDFYGGPLTVGTVVVTGSSGLGFFGPVTEQALAAFAGIQGLTGSHAGSVFTTGAQILLAPGDTAVQGRYRGMFIEANVSTTAYTGGSGEKNVLALTIPASLAKDWFTGQIPPSSLSLQLNGRVNATNQVGGRIRVELVQGVNIVDLLDWNAGPPAGNSPGGGLRIGIELFRTSAATFRTQNEIKFCGSIFEGPFFDLTAFLTTAGDFTINVYVTNAGNNPITIFRERLTI